VDAIHVSRGTLFPIREIRREICALVLHAPLTSIGCTFDRLELRTQEFARFVEIECKLNRPDPFTSVTTVLQPVADDKPFAARGQIPRNRVHSRAPVTWPDRNLGIARFERCVSDISFEAVRFQNSSVVYIDQGRDAVDKITGKILVSSEYVFHVSYINFSRFPEIVQKANQPLRVFMQLLRKAHGFGGRS
jgi:hypothetical protein